MALLAVVQVYQLVTGLLGTPTGAVADDCEVLTDLHTAQNSSQNGQCHTATQGKCHTALSCLQATRQG